MMTEIQQKAKELVCSYMFDRTDGNTFLIAKKCALIHINGLIIQNGELYLNGLDGKYYRDKNSYLFELKQAITEI